MCGVWCVVCVVCGGVCRVCWLCALVSQRPRLDNVTFSWTLNLWGTRLGQELPRLRTSASDFVPKRSRTLELAVGVARGEGRRHYVGRSPGGAQGAREEKSLRRFTKRDRRTRVRLFLVSPIFPLEIKLILVRLSLQFRNFFLAARVGVRGGLVFGKPAEAVANLCLRTSQVATLVRCSPLG